MYKQFERNDSQQFLYVFSLPQMLLYMILNAIEAVYQWLLFLRGKNGGIVRNRANFGKLFAIAVFLYHNKIVDIYRVFGSYISSEAVVRRTVILYIRNDDNETLLRIEVFRVKH